MGNQATSAGLPRIALVFGDAESVMHVRAAMAEHADIVYAATASEFDVSRLTSAHASTALVNLDGGDWLDDIQANLDAAGVATVFNDPEISDKLEGWARARWLRHLVAKLSGSSDVDPPRPVAVPHQSIPIAATMTVDAQETCAPHEDGIAAERPLSPEEIETMTADFVAEQEPAPMPTTRASNPAVATPGADTLAAAPELAAEPLAEMQPAVPAAVSEPAEPAAASTPGLQSTAPDFDADGSLDVDTEALSAMIDAKLSEPDGSAPSDSSQVWRVVSGGAVSPVHLEAITVEDPVATQAASVVEPVATPAGAASDDADVLADLPSLDDWQLVDPEAAAPAAAAHVERAPSEPSLDAFAGLELVPMETVAQVSVSAESTESWLYSGEPAKPKADAGHSGESGTGEASRGHG
ncbi:MAG: hypothetical protein ACREPK_06260 [Rhodanobacteraceae bacterium]